MSTKIKTKKVVSTKKLSPAKIAKIKKLGALTGKKKMSQRAIAKEVGCSRSSVWHHLQK